MTRPVLRFLPPYIIEKRHVDWAVPTLEAIFARIDAEAKVAEKP